MNLYVMNYKIIEMSNRGLAQKTMYVMLMVELKGNRSNYSAIEIVLFKG